jgi:hypothetical protein
LTDISWHTEQQVKSSKPEKASASERSVPAAAVLAE